MADKQFLQDVKGACVALICINAIIGPLVKYVYGYDNVHWMLVGPRMLFALLAGALLIGILMYERRHPHG